MDDWWLEHDGVICQGECCEEYIIREDTLFFINAAAFDSQRPDPFLEWTFNKKKINANFKSERCTQANKTTSLKWKLNKKIKTITIYTNKKEKKEYIIQYFNGIELILVEIWKEAYAYNSL